MSQKGDHSLPSSFGLANWITRAADSPADALRSDTSVNRNAYFAEK